MKKEKKPIGKPPTQVDWVVVDNLLATGCSGVEVSATLGIHPNTLYDACVRDKNCIFSEYLRERRAKGAAMLRAHQYKKAMGMTDVGDTTLLIWLGKTRLEQYEKKEIEQNITFNVVSYADSKE